MPTYRNERTGDVVTVEGANADRLKELDNWVEVKAEKSAAKKAAPKAEKD